MSYSLNRADSFIESEKSKVNFQYRPLFHMAPPVGWINDPNGVVFYQGEYHLFYQFHPYSSSWGPMHWGHAVTKDFFSYRQLPIALAPDRKDESGCFSGGAVVDPTNPNRLCLAYTQHFDDGKVRQRQNLAFSNDGIIFTKNTNPVLTEKDIPIRTSTSDFRDPRPIYIKPYYYLLVGSKNDKGIGQILVFRSIDLLSFKYHFTIGPDSRFGTMGECPDFFSLGNRQVLFVSATGLQSDGKSFKNVNSSLAFIGKFNLEKKTYQIDTFQEIDHGHSFYAPQTLKDNKNRRLMWAWMNMWAKPNFTGDLGHNWSGSLTFPRLLSIKNNHLRQNLPSEVKNHLEPAIKYNGSTLIEKQTLITLLAKTTSNWTLSFSNPNQIDDKFEISCTNGAIILDTSKCAQMPLPPRQSFVKLPKVINIQILLDTSSVELFINDGEETVTTLVYIASDKYLLTLQEGKENVKKIHIHKIKTENKK